MVIPVFIAVPAVILSNDIVSGGLCYKFITKAFKRLIHIFFKLVDVSSFTKGHHQNYSEIRKQHHIIKFKN